MDYEPFARLLVEVVRCQDSDTIVIKTAAEQTIDAVRERNEELNAELATAYAELDRANARLKKRRKR